jgi:guanine deaminase
MQCAGIRAFIGKLSMDISSRPTYVETSVDASLDSARSFISRCRALVEDFLPHERLVEPVLTPRFVPTCSDELLQGLGQLSENEDLKIQSHLAEAYDEVEWVRKERGMEDIDVFEKVQTKFQRGTPRRLLIVPIIAQTSGPTNDTSPLYIPLSARPLSHMRARNRYRPLPIIQRLLLCGAIPSERSTKPKCESRFGHRYRGRV